MDNRNLTDLEQTQCLYLVQFVKCEAVVDSGRNDEKITRYDMDTNPLVRGVIYIRGFINGCKLEFWGISTHRVHRRSPNQKECSESLRLRAYAYGVDRGMAIGSQLL